MTIKVRAKAYDEAARELVAANQQSAVTYEQLTSALGGYGAMAGDDATSTEFSAEYDAGATEAVGGLKDLVEAYANVAHLLAASGSNHRRANQESVYNAPVYDDLTDPLGDEPVQVPAYTPPSSEGGDNEDLPEFWNYIQDHLEGFAWPNADTDKLKQAASTWRSHAANVLLRQDRIETAMNTLEEIESPEIPMVISALQELRGNTADVAQAMTDAGDACQAYAEQVEEHREVIKGILRDLAIEAGISVAVGVVTSFFTFGGGAAAGTAIAGWRAVAAARKVLTALRALKAAAKAKAVAKLTSLISKVRVLRPKLLKFRNAKKVDALPTRPQRVNGKLPKKGEPGSYGYDKDGNLLPYANSRPDYGPTQVDDVWKNAPRDANGDVWVRDRDGNLVKVEWEPGDPRKGKWDMGHVPDHEYRDLLDDYLSGKISKEKFLEEYRDPDNYRVEHPGRNQSHVDEGGR